MRVLREARLLSCWSFGFDLRGQRHNTGLDLIGWQTAPEKSTTRVYAGLSYRALLRNVEEHDHEGVPRYRE